MKRILSFLVCCLMVLPMASQQKKTVTPQKRKTTVSQPKKTTFESELVIGYTDMDGFAKEEKKHTDDL